MGEFELLARIRERLPPTGSRVRVGAGDDAAVTIPGGATATSVDAVVDGVHFRRDRSNLRQIGHKALAAALSDLAAMGAEPGEAYTVLGVPPDLDEDGCVELFDGIAALAALTGTTLAGGDIVRAAALTLAMTVVGHAPRAEAFVTRSGAQAGDAIVLTGEIGAAAAGLLLLEHEELTASIDKDVSAALLARQLTPEPRLRAGQALARSGATAMIDVSDGLGADAGHLSRRSGIRLRIDVGTLPLADGVAEVAAAAGLDAERTAVSRGEDYELLATLPHSQLQSAVAAVSASGLKLTPIGTVGDGDGVEIRLPGGRLLEPEGFDQLG